MQCLPIIYLAEDDDGHAFLLQSGLRQAGFHNPVIRFRDGQEAVDYFAAPDPAPPLTVAPRVLLLDIRMPKIGGIEVLRRIRGDSRFDSMPVIMLTTTDDPAEAQHCLQLGCNSYVVKPVNAKRFHAAICGLSGYLSAPDATAPAP